MNIVALPEGMPATSSDIIASLNEQLIQVLQELALKDNTMQQLGSEIKVLWLWFM